jgi:hypothetical protein
VARRRRQALEHLAVELVQAIGSDRHAV